MNGDQLEVDLLKTVVQKACAVIREYMYRDIDASMAYKKTVAEWEDYLKPGTTIDVWLTYGMENGFCSDVACVTHDGLPSTAEEDAAWEQGEDPCVPGTRIWFND